MIKTQITIASQTVDCFLSDAQEYLYSLTSAADLLNKSPMSAYQLINSKAFKSKHGKDFTTYHHPKENGGILLPSPVVGNHQIPCPPRNPERQ